MRKKIEEFILRKISERLSHMRWWEVERLFNIIACMLTFTAGVLFILSLGIPLLILQLLYPSINSEDFCNNNRGLGVAAFVFYGLIAPVALRIFMYYVASIVDRKLNRLYLKIEEFRNSEKKKITKNNKN